MHNRLVAPTQPPSVTDAVEPAASLPEPPRSSPEEQPQISYMFENRFSEKSSSLSDGRSIRRRSLPLQIGPGGSFMPMLASARSADMPRMN